MIFYFIGNQECDIVSVDSQAVKLPPFPFSSSTSILYSKKFSVGTGLLFSCHSPTSFFGCPLIPSHHISRTIFSIFSQNTITSHSQGLRCNGFQQHVSQSDIHGAVIGIQLFECS